MKINNVENQIKEEISKCQFKIDNKDSLHLTNLTINQYLGKKMGLETALEIIKNNK